MHRVLWQEYGIPFDDMTYSEVIQAINLHEAERQRKAIDDAKERKLMIELGIMRRF